MADKAHKMTDEEIRKLEKELKKIYQQANDELTEKLEKTLESLGDDIPKIYQEYKQLKADGLKEEAEAKLKEYKKALTEALRSKEFYKEQIEAITNDISKLNERALAYSLDRIPKVYGINYNTVGKGISAHVNGYSFHIADQHTVKLMTKRITSKRINKSKDKRWTNKKVNSQILQGILQGEPITDIAKRIQNVTDSTYKASVRTARTMMTEAQSAGRMDCYHDLEDDGLILKKIWMATPDERTRRSHLELDGIEKELDEPFETINGNELMYPGDPDGVPEEIYNCRCTLVTHVVGFIDDNGVEHKLNYLEEPDPHGDAIKRERKKRDDDGD